MLITGILIFIYLITPALQENVFKIRDSVTKANLSYIRAMVLAYYKDHNRWPNSLRELVPKYMKDIPKEYLSSIRGSNKVISANDDNNFVSLRGPGLEGWIYGAYDPNKGKKYSRKVLPMSTTLSDGSGDTSSW
jgi:type II secretory pathway pseudopilin PulG